MVGTIDLDLIFLHENALGALASRLRTEPLPQAVLERLAAQSPKDLKRAELALAIMTARAASTGYMASAPPSLPLDHSFRWEKSWASQAPPRSSSSDCSKAASC